MTIDRGLLAILKAKPGKGDEFGAFLKEGRARVSASPAVATDRR